MVRVLTMVVVAVACWTSAGLADPRSVPAEFVKFVDPPGEADQFLRPSAVVVDRNFHEILVADPGHNRVVVFDRHGTYRFEFPGTGYFSTPVDVAVDSEGYLYVLGSTSAGRRLFRFDFDGLYLDEVTLPTSEGRAQYTSLAIDASDRLFLLDHGDPAIRVLDREGSLLGSIPLLRNLEPELRRDQVIGAIEVKDGQLFVPVSSLGTVLIHRPDGEFVRAIGHKGTVVGELNFPVAVALTDGDLVLVLDKHRFTVACFDLNGVFLGEFGGKGLSPGWFYYPSLLAVDEQQQVYVGQIFRSRVQVCRIPEFIRAAHLRGQLDEVESTARRGDLSKEGLSESTANSSSPARGGETPSQNDPSSIPDFASNVRDETTLH